MSWQYRITSGGLYAASELLKTNPQATAFGYSGAHGTPQNNPAYVQVHNVGPIPVGHYSIGAPHDTVSHGPYVLPLTPDAGNEMHGRSGFLCHGDNSKGDRSASEGCVIMPRNVRETVWNSGDRTLQVIS